MHTILISLMFFVLFLFRPSLSVAERIIIAYPSPSTTLLPLLVAQRHGFFNSENLQLDLVQVRPDIAMSGLLSGNVDYTTAVNRLITARIQGAPLVLTAILVDKPVDSLVGAKGITSPQDLKGKVVGVSSFGSPTHFLTLLTLAAIGLDPKTDVELRTVGDEAIRLDGLRTGLIQGALLGPQGVLQAEKHNLVAIAPVSRLIKSMAFVGMGTTIKRVKENSEQVRRVLRAAIRGLRFVHENRSGTVNMIESWFKLDNKTASRTYDLVAHTYSGNGEVAEEGVSLVLRFIKEYGKIETEISPSDLVDYTLLRQARKNLGLP